MSFEQLLTVGIILLYSFGTLGIFMGTLSMRRQIKVVSNWITLAGFALHTVAVLTALARSPFSELSAGYFMQVLSWIVIFLYLAAWRFLRLPFLALTAAPLALLVYILSLRLSDVTDVLPAKLSVLFFGLHVCSLFISIGLMTMAFGAGLLFIYMEHKLKTKAPIAEFAKEFPALTIYDKVNRFSVLVGFPLYTLGLMSSFIWLPLSHTQLENPKVVLSFFIWFLYALLFYQRMALGFHGRKTALMAIAIFCASVLSLVLDQFFTPHGTILLQL